MYVGGLFCWNFCVLTVLLLFRFHKDLRKMMNLSLSFLLFLWRKKDWSKKINLTGSKVYFLFPLFPFMFSCQFFFFFDSIKRSAKEGKMKGNHKGFHVFFFFSIFFFVFDNKNKGRERKKTTKKVLCERKENLLFPFFSLSKENFWYPLCALVFVCVCVRLFWLWLAFFSLFLSSFLLFWRHQQQQQWSYCLTVCCLTWKKEGKTEREIL
jgi:hypothetical protein